MYTRERVVVWLDTFLNVKESDEDMKTSLSEPILPIIHLYHLFMFMYI